MPVPATAWALLLGNALCAQAPPSSPAAELRWAADAQGGAPYVFQDPKDPNRVIGFEVDLVEAVSARMGMHARLVTGPWDKLSQLVLRGDVEVACNGMEETPELAGQMRLSRPYFEAPLLLTVRAGDADAAQDLNGLRGRPAGTLPGSMAERVLTRAGAEVRTYEGGQDDVYADLRLGRTDAVLMDGPVARYYADIEPTLVTLTSPAGSLRYVMLMHPDAAALQARINMALEQLSRDGTLEAIYTRWGIHNDSTARLMGRAPPDPHAPAPQWDAWRAANGKPASLLERALTRYPAMMGPLLRGAGLTLLVSVCSMAMAVLLGLLLALARWRGPRALSAVAWVYVEFFRGTPLLIQLTMLYFGLPELGVRLDPLLAGILALGLNYAAAEAENQRAGLLSVPQGQLDAAQVLGLGRWKTFRFVVWPQALRISLPPITNDFIALLKDSSLVSMVTLTELTKTYVNLANATRDHLGLGALVALMYLALGLPAARLSRRLEARLSRHLSP